MRLSILRVQPRLRRNWLTLAIAQFLASDHAGASRTLTYYENMLREVPKGDIEMGEVLLFHAKVLEEAGEYEKCLEFLGEKSEQIPDRDAYGVQRGAFPFSLPFPPLSSSPFPFSPFPSPIRFSRPYSHRQLTPLSLPSARLLLLLSRGDPALWAWETLLSENPESRFNIRSTILAKGGNPDAAYDDEEGRKKAVEIVEELGEKYPGSAAIRRLGLDLAVGTPTPSFIPLSPLSPVNAGGTDSSPLSLRVQATTSARNSPRTSSSASPRAFPPSSPTSKRCTSSRTERARTRPRS